MEDRNKTTGTENGPENLEDALRRLDAVLDRLENAEDDLETSFSVYEEGVKLVKYANEQIDRIEKKCLVIDEDGGLHEL